MITAFGVFLLFDQIENLYHDNEYFMWDHEITLVPIVYVAFWAITGMVNTNRDKVEAFGTPCRG